MVVESQIVMASVRGVGGSLSVVRRGKEKPEMATADVLWVEKDFEQSLLLFFWYQLQIDFFTKVLFRYGEVSVYRTTSR